MARSKKRSDIYLFFKQFNLRLLLALLILFIILAVYGLRQNNIEMISLKNQLMAADRDNGNVNGDLNKLRLFIYNHMNTNPSSSSGVYPPIQLKYTYQRLLAQAQVGAVAISNQDRANKAAVYCHDLGSGYSASQLATCESWYVKNQPGTTVTIPPALYQFDFISPIWSPDLAGFSILISFALAIALVAMFLFEKFSK